LKSAVAIVLTEELVRKVFGIDPSLTLINIQKDHQRDCYVMSLRTGFDHSGGPVETTVLERDVVLEHTDEGAFYREVWFR